MAERTGFTVGICSFNEAKNIAKCIESVFSQEFTTLELKEVIVVSSGSTDDTEDIVNSLIKKYPDLKLISQNSREGKNSAINNFLAMKTTELVAMVNADNILKNKTTLQHLVEPLLDPGVGVTGGHPIPVNKTDHFSGFASQLIWSYHHHIAIESTKIGELIAFRDIGIELPLDTQSDEDYIRKAVEGKGLKAVYVPGAETMIMGPDCLKDLIIQRERVNIGQSYMKKRENYYNPSRDPHVLMKVFTDVVKDVGFHPFRIGLSIAVESYCRLRGKMYVDARKDDISVWKTVESTKKVK